ncbi:M14 family metallopeptidase [Pricia sp. S334]|uniref:M14 family metallopeptidase n=1 Tax=Pricia mediterranea TaxID=3076079 RepID=A0ABU3L9H8_9FLAO|nr:M14 family metallopeptidase [Pricia sp. S334]MDT7830396.1 M14 family metallopeptidase [Pricia sp. S334]
MTLTSIEYQSIKEKGICGRYLTHDQIEDFLSAPKNLEVRPVGKSVLGVPIDQMKLGEGPVKILMWSQMHGNESTTTKAVLDLINYLNADLPTSRTILKQCTIMMIPILNPDGAMAYTRANANGIDLNRDAQERSQPESRVLREVFDEFQPDYCFNLHDQRTIFNVGNTPKPATVSFLAPAHDEARSVSVSRGVAMKLVVAMNEQLQNRIPGQVGRYDDAYNANCVGDAFQMTDTPTVLFEAGHYPEDYEREKTRKFIFQALLKGLTIIAENDFNELNVSDYFLIPENQKRYFDILVHNAHVLDSSLIEGDAVGILYKETLVDGAIEFIPKIEKSGNLKGYFGHRTYNALADEDFKIIEGNPTWIDLFR